MVHIATEVLDSGPVLAYTKFPIRGGEFDGLWQDVEGKSLQELQAHGEEQPLFKRIRAEGLKRERPVMLAVLQALANGEMRVALNQILDRNGKPMTEPRNMNAEVERFLAEGN